MPVVDFADDIVILCGFFLRVPASSPLVSVRLPCALSILDGYRRSWIRETYWIRKVDHPRGLHAADDSTEHRTGAALLGEDDDAHPVRFCVFGSFQGEGDWARGESLYTANLLQGTDDAGVLQSTAAVFAGANIRYVGGVDQGGIEVCVRVLMRGRRRMPRSCVRPRQAARALA